VTFYNKKWGFLYSVFRSLINWQEVILAVGTCFSSAWTKKQWPL